MMEVEKFTSESSSRKYSFKTVFVLLLVVSLVSSLVVAGLTYAIVSNSNQLAYGQPLSYGMEIEGPSKLGVGETGTYTAQLNASISGLTFDWQIYPKEDVTFSADGDTATLTFDSATERAYLITVTVTDASGGYGFASKTVYDPFVARNIYMQDIPSTANYVIRYDDVAYYWATRDDGYIAYSDTNSTAVQEDVVSALTSSGGTIYLTEVQWNSSISLPSNILVIEDYQGKRSYYTQQTIDFNQTQLEEGVFHKGSSPPPSPVAGQWFYDTDDYSLYVYNGTAWDIQGGGTGPAGPAGKVEGLPFSYLVFANSTATYMLNGTTGEIEWSSPDSTVVVNAAMGNLTWGRTFLETVLMKGDFSLNKRVGDTWALEIPVYTKLILDGSATLNPNQDCNLIYSKGTAYDDMNTNIEIIGGEWDSNEANQGATAIATVNFEFVSNFTIRDATMHGSNWRVMSLIGCSEGDVTFNHVYDENQNAHGIYLEGTSHTSVTQNKVIDLEGGIYLSTSEENGKRVSEYNTVSLNFIDTIVRDGISLYPSDTANHFCRFNVIADNTIIDAGTDKTHHGIKVGHHTGANSLAYQNDITGNIIIASVDVSSGITAFTGAYDNNIVANQINMSYYGSAIIIVGDGHNVIGNYLYQGNPSGIAIAGNNTLVQGNYIYDSDDWAIQIDAGGGGNNFITGNYINGQTNDNAIEIRNTGCLGNVIFGNYLINCDGSATTINDVGGWADNWHLWNYEDEYGWIETKFLTKKVGVALNVVNGTWVAHGLVGTPDVVDLTVEGLMYINSTSHLLTPSVSSTNSTHFEISFYYWNTASPYTYAVTSTEQRDVYWRAFKI